MTKVETDQPRIPQRRSIVLTCGVVLLLACTPPPVDEAATDAGASDSSATSDAARPDGEQRDAESAVDRAGTCTEPRRLRLEMGNQRIVGDTRGAPSELDNECGDVRSLAGEVGQDILALEYPESSFPLAMRVSLANDVTPPTFDAQVQLFDDCLARMSSYSCDDGAVIDGRVDRRPQSIWLIPEREVWLAITGAASSGYTSEGPYALDVEVMRWSSPTLSSVTAVLIDDDVLRVRAVGRDDDESDYPSYVTVFPLDTSGTLIPWEGDNVLQVTDASAGVPEFDLVVRRSGVRGAEWSTAASVRVSVQDALILESAPLTVPLGRGTHVALGDACDDVTAFCRLGQRCDGTCLLTNAAVAACGGALATEVSTTQSTVRVGVVADDRSGDGGLVGTCQPIDAPYSNVASADQETVLRVAIPAGRWDLLTTSAVAAGDDIRTFLYAYGNTCGNSADELGCARSTAGPLELRDVTGVIHVVVDATFEPEAPLFRTSLPQSAEVDVRFWLRPVRESGASCDTTLEADRCASGACLSTGRCP